VAAVVGSALLIPAAAGAAETEEVGFVDPATGQWSLGPDERFFFGVPGDIPFLGDWDGDGTDTPGLYRPTNGFAYLINRRETGVADHSWFMGIPGDIPLVGDWDGDGTDTFSVYRPSEGKVYINNRNATSVAQNEYYFGVPGDTPFATDFNGDGIDDVGLHRASTGLVYMTDALPDGDVAGTDLQFFWGIGGDAIVAGDWTGDGTDSPGLLRPSQARAYFRYGNTEGIADEDWPTEFPDWIPVVGRIPGGAHRFDVELSGAAVVPGPGDPTAGGAITLQVSTGGQICVTLDLGGPAGVAAAHIHEGRVGFPGPVAVDLGISGGATFGCVAADAAATINLIRRPEDFFVQLHSTAYPDGALRGQVAETRSWELSLVGADVVGLGDADGFVTLTVDVSTTGRLCLAGYEAQRISTVTSIGLYRASASETGPRVADLTLAPDHTGCVVIEPSTAAARVLATPTEHYVQVTTAQFPSGAVRAQLTNGA
jgi:hypothetical protein